MSKKMIRVADYIFKYIADLGVNDVFMLPGGGAMYLNDAIACEKRIRPIPCHHEQACGIAAEAYGRVNPAGFGVAVVTTGPGATNIVTPVVGSWIESLPLLIISGQVKRQDALNGRPLRQNGVQEVDIISMVKNVTKYAVTIQNPKDVKRCFEEAIWHMKNGRPGPVWLDVPLDVQAAQIDENHLIGFTPTTLNCDGDLHQENLILEINKLVSSAERPLILVGHGVRISGGSGLLKKVGEELGIPCVFTWNASDIMHWQHELYVGRPGVVAARAPNFAVQNCDCLIAIGCRIDNIITAYNPKRFARFAKKIIVDIDENELKRHLFEIDISVNLDAKKFLELWARKLPTQHIAWEDWRKKCLDWKSRYDPQEGKQDNQTGLMTHFQFVDALSDAIPEGQLIVTGSSGLAVEVFYTAYRNKKNQRMFLTSGLGSMGYGVPAAIGACIGAGGVSTICVESDGSLMLNLQELVTLKNLNLPITLVIMNNNGYASIRNTQKNYFSSRYIGSGPESGLLMPNFSDLSKALGLEYIKVDDVKEIDTSLFKGGLRVIEVILEENETLSPKVSALPQADGTMLSMPLEDMTPLLPREVLRNEMLVPLDPVSETLHV